MENEGFFVFTGSDVSEEIELMWRKARQANRAKSEKFDDSSADILRANTDLTEDLAQSVLIEDSLKRFNSVESVNLRVESNMEIINDTANFEMIESAIITAPISDVMDSIQLKENTNGKENIRQLYDIAESQLNLLNNVTITSDNNIIPLNDAYNKISNSNKENINYRKTEYLKDVKFDFSVIDSTINFNVENKENCSNKKKPVSGIPIKIMQPKLRLNYENVINSTSSKTPCKLKITPQRYNTGSSSALGSKANLLRPAVLNLNNLKQQIRPIKATYLNKNPTLQENFKGNKVLKQNFAKTPDNKKFIINKPKCDIKKTNETPIKQNMQLKETQFKTPNSCSKIKFNGNKLKTPTSAILPGSKKYYKLIRSPVADYIHTVTSTIDAMTKN